MFQLAKVLLGNPGEIKGTINNDDLGEITTNSNFGIFGNISSEKLKEYEDIESVQLGLRNSIKLGEAKIISNFSGERKEYKVMIDKIYLDDTEDNKNFVVRIIDDELISQTRRNNKGVVSEVQFYKMENL